MDTAQIAQDLLKYTDTTSIGINSSLSELGPQEFSFRGEIFNILISLFIILGIIFMILGIMKKYNLTKYFNKYLDKEDIPGKLRIISKISLGNKKNLCLIEFNEQQILLGVTDNNISFLSSSKVGTNFATELSSEQNKQ